MAERDRFELDLADALRAYALEAPTHVRPTELARQFAAAYPHGRGAFGPWRWPSVPRLAWFLLIVAGLLAVIVGGILVAGSQPRRELPAVVPPVGQVFACPPGSNPDEPGPVDQARPPRDGLLQMAFDRDSGRIVLLASLDDALLGAETWTFDVCTNTWMRMRPNREAWPGGDIVHDADSDLTIVAGYTTGAWAYDLESNSWADKGPLPRDGGPATSLVYDPVSGLVVGFGTSGEANAAEVWTYEVESDTWTPVHQPDAPVVEEGSFPGLLAYDASVDRLILYDGPNSMTWLIDLRSGTWSRSGAAPPLLPLWPPFAGTIAYDEARERSVAFGAGVVVAYDASADTWETLDGVPMRRDGQMPSPPATGPTARVHHSMVYDPVNERLVVAGGEYRTADGWVAADDVLAFDPAAREWIQLLQPSEVATPRR